jgi:hypothetical protein
VLPASLNHNFFCHILSHFAALQLSQLPLSCGIGGFLLARAAAEMLCEALAASWAAGCAAPVRRLMLLPQGLSSAKPERMVSTVVTASYCVGAAIVLRLVLLSQVV